MYFFIFVDLYRNNKYNYKNNVLTTHIKQNEPSTINKSMKTCIKNRNSIKNNNSFMDSHHINNDIDCGTKLCNTSKKHFDTHQIDLKVKDVKTQCNQFKFYEPKPLYMYELLVKCENAQQIEYIKNNILKSSLILNETISKSIEEIEHLEDMQGISHQKCKLKCEDFEKWNETLEFDSIHVVRLDA